MTDQPIPPADEQVRVEQRHRDAAKDVLRHLNQKGVFNTLSDAERIYQAFARFERDHLTRPPVVDGRVIERQIPPFISVTGFDDRSEERACINGCLYLRADFAARRFTALAMRPAPETTASDDVVEVGEPSDERHAEVTRLHELGAPASHVLKTWPPFFQQVLDGEKTFEVRKDDRGFAVGDILDLVEYDPNDGAEYGLHHTGRNAFRRVSYVLKGGQFGIEPGYVVLALANLPKPTEQATSPAPDAVLRAAALDALAGWRYIRMQHGDLYGVGWDRVENALTAALASPASTAEGEV